MRLQDFLDKIFGRQPTFKMNHNKPLYLFVISQS